MLESKFKKQVGFIKGHSSKKDLLLNKQLDDSSDSFSSFEYNPAQRKDEFSPFKYPIDTKSNPKIYAKSKQRQNIGSQLRHRNEIQEPKFTNLVLRNNFVKEALNKKSNDKIVESELKKINRKINQVKSRIENQEIQMIEERSDDETPKLRESQKQQPYVQEQEELSLSNINKFQKQPQSEVFELQSRQAQKQPKTIAQYRKYLEESSSEQEEEEQELKYKKTIKHKENVNRNYNEELITQWDKRQFKDKSMKTAILEHNKQNRRNQPQEGYVEAKGGVYFEVDTKQFKAKPSKHPVVQSKKKRVELNSREQIMIRRQTAKRYDREARSKLFGYYG